jgi:hypothetical protein
MWSGTIIDLLGYFSSIKKLRIYQIQHPVLQSKVIADWEI